MVTRRRHRAARALTLMELMIAMAIATMVALLIASAIRLVVVRFADDTGIRQEAGREERVRTLMHSQLAWLELEPDRTPRRFMGAPDGIEFRTMMSAETPHERASTVARYAVESVIGSPASQRLVYLERAVSANEIGREEAFAQVGASADTSGVGGPERAVIADVARDSALGRPVLEGAKSIVFEYLTFNGQTPIWSRSWTDADTLPRGVRVTFESHNGVKSSWVLPVVVTF
jgi:hypothetical protein